MSSIKFTEIAYCKMILHAIKYPHCTVNGVLLAKPSNSNNEVEFVDCIPLFHVCVNLTPMAEIALMQIDEYASKKNLVIGGYYVAPENPKDQSFDKVYNRIFDKIAANNTNPSYVVIVNSTNSTIQRGRIALKVGQYSDGNYKLCEDISVSDDSMNVCISGINTTMYNKIVDFDNHLDDIQLDWTNTDLNKEIRSFL
ncbi:unnamed protein product [Phyllotreta striolata]|uniref:MPN domain-containing protein n=1 Tax=Phyllotreta striolata TaxID=444603 RepID=A0A9N9TPY5_PHYSR|nr:unnamed protein product [Phyllotreta striolata]